MSAYVTLERRFKRLADLGGAAAALNWDQAVMMPKGGNAARGEQLAALGGLVHEILTAPQTGDLIEAAAAEPLDAWQGANLALVRRRFDRVRRLDYVRLDHRGHRLDPSSHEPLDGGDALGVLGVL